MQNFSEFFEPENWRKIISGGWDNTIEQFMTTYDVLFDANSLVPVKSRSGMLYQIGKKEGMTNLGENKSEVLSVDRAVFKKELKELLSQYTDVTSFDFFHLATAIMIFLLSSLSPASSQGRNASRAPPRATLSSRG